MNDVEEDLKSAKALIADPEKWNQGYFDGKNGTCFCAAGALRKATWGSTWISEATPDGMRRYNHAITVLARTIDPEVDEDGNSAWTTVYDFNDAKTTTHADVMAVYDRAIKLAPVAGLERVG
jgi:hypothetical protein